MHIHDRRLSFRCLVVTLLFIGLAGCSTTLTVVNDTENRSPNRFISVENFNQDVKDRTVQINILDGTKIHADGLKLAGDSLYFRDTSTHSEPRLYTQSIRNIEWKDRMGGVLDGLLIIGVPMFITSGVAAGWGPPHNGVEPVILAGATTSVAAFAYALVGHTQYYVMPADTSFR